MARPLDIPTFREYAILHIAEKYSLTQADAAVFVRVAVDAPELAEMEPHWETLITANQMTLLWLNIVLNKLFETWRDSK